MPLIRYSDPANFKPPDGHTKLEQDDYDHGLTYDRERRLHFYGQPFAQELKVGKLLNFSIVFGALASGIFALVSLYVVVFGPIYKDKSTTPIEITISPASAGDFSWDCQYVSSENASDNKYKVICAGEHK